MIARLLTLSVSLAAAGCATATPFARQQCVTPDANLAAVLRPYEELRAVGCTPECERLRREIERLAVVCPAHAPTLMANAVLAYDERRPETARQFLDILLAQPGSHADAAVLRARIAVEDGNLPFANRLLQQQIKLSPDHAGLRETFGGALFLARQYPAAVRELTTAAALGAPKWRVAYHLGLIHEAEGRMDEAARQYTEALTANPGWSVAQSRLNGLRGSTR